MPSDAEQAFRFTGAVRDFFYLVLGRNSFDDNDGDGPKGGGPLESYVRYGNTRNAFWCPSKSYDCPKANVMVFGPGYAGAVDIVAHEMAHGVISHEADLVYSDEPLLIGEVFPMTPEQTSALGSGLTSEPEISDLDAAENRLENADERLIEVYVPIQALDGTPLLVESYLRLDAALTSGRLVATQVLPLALAGLALLVILQWPLAWRLARDLRAGHLARERLLQRAADSSVDERRRIAGELHDGLVQSLAGVALDLAGSADRSADAKSADDLRRGADGVRASMREARSLLVELYPPNLRSAGLANAVTDLAAKVSARGIAVITDISDDESLSDADQAVVFRVAQESLRNVVKHSGAAHVRVGLTVMSGRCDLVITDDGRGIDDGADRSGRDSGHLGLAVLRDLTQEAGASFDIRRAEPSGTIVTLHLAAPA